MDTTELSPAHMGGKQIEEEDNWEEDGDEDQPPSLDLEPPTFTPPPTTPTEPTAEPTTESKPAPNPVPVTVAVELVVNGGLSNGVTETAGPALVVGGAIDGAAETPPVADESPAAAAESEAAEPDVSDAEAATEPAPAPTSPPPAAVEPEPAATPDSPVAKSSNLSRAAKGRASVNLLDCRLSNETTTDGDLAEASVGDTAESPPVPSGDPPMPDTPTPNSARAGIIRDGRSKSSKPNGSGAGIIRDVRSKSNKETRRLSVEDAHIAFDVMYPVVASEDLQVHRLANGSSPGSSRRASDAGSGGHDSPDSNPAPDAIPEHGISPEELATRLGSGDMDTMRLSDRVTRHLSFGGSRARPKLRDHDTPLAAITLSGRIGHGHIINGDYDLDPGEQHEGGMVFSHADPIPDGYEGLSGVHLKIFYSKTNDAWAIAPNVGSLEVLAYVHGNVLSPEFDSANAGEMTWVIANENGEYEIDPDVIVSGALLEGADESDGTQTDDDDGDGVSGSMSTVAEASDVFATEEDDEKHGRRFSISRAIMKRIKKKKSSSSSSRNSSSGSHGGKSGGHGGKKKRGRRRRQAEMPSITAKKVLVSFQAKTSPASRKGLVVQMRNLARKPPGDEHEPPEHLCDVMVEIWIAILECLDSTPATDQDYFFNTIVAIMLREDFDSHGIAFTSDEARAGRALDASLRTNIYVAEKIAPISLAMSPEMTFFCAKVLSINYFRLPGFANDIVSAITDKTRTTGVRGRRIGVQVLDEAAAAHGKIGMRLPADKKATFATLNSICEVDVAGAPGAGELEARKWLMPGTRLGPPQEVTESIAQWRPDGESFAWKIKTDQYRSKAATDVWGRRFFFAGVQGMEFLGIFLEILFRRARDIFEFKYFLSKPDQRLGINEHSALGFVYMPGYTELITCFLRTIMMTEVALKPLHRVGHGPPSIVCNWTDRVAQCALALSKDGVFFSCMSRDMMEQTSLTHIVDVMALLHSLKLFMDSYCQMHQEQFADSINIELFASFFKQLVGCKHYVVTMFTLRWLYESIDYFSAAHRVAIFATLISWDLLDNTFCHWEPAIRHLTHNLILYRLVPSAHRENQQELFESLDALLQGDEPGTGMSNSDDQNTLQLSTSAQCESIIEYVKNILVCHGAIIVPPASSTPRLDELRKNPLYRSKYATRSVDELKATLEDAVKWVGGHRATTNDEMYPPVSIHLPPLQHMTSAFNEDRMRK